MNIKSYNYPLGIKVAKYGATLMSILLLLFLLLMIGTFLVDPTILIQDPFYGIGVTLALAFGILLSSYLANYWSDIKINDNAIFVRFFWHWIRVPWNDVVSINRTKTKFFQEYIICAKRLTIIHRMIGLVHLFNSRPCFIIDSRINGFQEIILEIENKVQMRHG